MPTPTELAALKAEELRIEEELTKLKLARLKLGHFTTYTFPGYREAKHQSMLDEKLEAVERFVASDGKEGIGRLIVTMPPRHGKSEKVSIRFPAWFLGRNPDRRVIITSYGASLSEYFSREVRNLMEGPDYQKVFGTARAIRPGEPVVKVDPDGRSVQSWELLGHRGGLVAGGVGGPLTGRGADVLIIDDPIKDDEEAQSETMRQKIVDWYTSVAYTRLEGSGAVIVMMTRWHEADLVGWLLEKQSDKWEVLNLPALAEDNDPMGRQYGEALWPDKYNVAALLDKKSVLPSRHWNSLYQQHPSGESGDVFTQDWFVYGKLPDPSDITYGVQVWDCAMTEKETSDFSACVTAYVTPYGVFIADVFQGRLNFPDLKQRMIDMHQQWSRYSRISRICIENRVAGTSMLQSLRKDSHLPVIPMEPESKLGKSKLQRANSVAGYVQSGRVIFRAGATWLPEFEDQLLKFPNAKHDDMVDAFVYALIQTNGGGVQKFSKVASLRERYQVIGGGGHSDRLSALAGEW